MQNIVVKKIVPALAVFAFAIFGPMAWGQSSGGNYTASVDNTICSINSATGGFVPPFTNAEGGELTATVKLPNSSPGLVVRPSLVTGLYTNTLSISDTQSRTAAVVVVVKDTVNGVTTDLTPNNTCVVTNTQGTQCGTVYDERFQLLSTVLGTSESVQLILSTLAAHSFEFVRGTAPGGTHTVKMKWFFGCDDGTGTLRTSACTTTLAPNTAAACAGPGVLSVQQVQQFQHSSQIGTTGP